MKCSSSWISINEILVENHASLLDSCLRKCEELHSSRQAERRADGCEPQLIVPEFVSHLFKDAVFKDEADFETNCHHCGKPIVVCVEKELIIVVKPLIKMDMRQELTHNKGDE